MRLRHVALSSMIALVFVIVAFWSGSATANLRHGAAPVPPASPATQSAMVSAAKPVLLPVADRTILTTPKPHHPTSRHYKPVRQNSRQAQQYYQPARQYYQWQVH